MAAARLDDLPGWARGLIERAPIGRLGVIDDDARPRVLPVTFAPVDGVIWSAVDDKPKRAPGRELARVRWLRRRPEAAVTVDEYDDDWSKLAWVQALGTVEILDHAPDPVMAALAAKYAQYVERPPRGPFLALSPERFVHWRAGTSS